MLLGAGSVQCSLAESSALAAKCEVSYTNPVLPCASPSKYPDLPQLMYKQHFFVEVVPFIVKFFHSAQGGGPRGQASPTTSSSPPNCVSRCVDSCVPLQAPNPATYGRSPTFYTKSQDRFSLGSCLRYVRCEGGGQRSDH